MNAKEMPRYRCHKEVMALKIKKVVLNILDGSYSLEFEEEGYDPIVVNHMFMLKHAPKAGGYYVIYADGYASWSPAEAFEAGYTRLI